MSTFGGSPRAREPTLSSWSFRSTEWSGSGASAPSTFRLRLISIQGAPSGRAACARVCDITSVRCGGHTGTSTTCGLQLPSSASGRPPTLAGSSVRGRQPHARSLGRKRFPASEPRIAGAVHTSSRLRASPDGRYSVRSSSPWLRAAHPFASPRSASSAWPSFAERSRLIR